MRLKPILLSATCISLLVSGCTPLWVTTRAGHPTGPAGFVSAGIPHLKQQIDAVLADSLFPPSNAGIKVVSLTRNETLYELNPRLLFHPASNQKLFTAATALAELGPDFLLTTIVGIDSSSARIVIRGGGDPLLTTTDLDSIIRMIYGRLDTVRGWTIVGDASYFDDHYWGAGWNWDDEPDETAMFVTPLSINHNCIQVRVKPGKKSGDSVEATLAPATRYVSIENRGVTVSDTVRKRIEVSRKWKERSNVITIDGEMRTSDSGRSYTVSIWQPERYFLTLAAEQLEKLGIRIEGIELTTSPPEFGELICYERRLDSAVTYMNKVSDNLSAENILKVLGAEKKGQPGTTAAGLRVLKERLVVLGVDTTRFVSADGSGVSRYNLVSAEQIVKLLAAAYEDTALFVPFNHSLPVAGQDGSLAERMKGTPAQGNLRAKTGTLTGVSSLSGYVRSADGELLAFSIVMQNYSGPTRPYRLVQDRIGMMLAGFRR